MSAQFDSLEDLDTSRLEAVLETDKGAITLEFLAEEAPETVANFVKLANDGFYDGLCFHRIIKNFMVQTGCPRGDGTGGPGYTIDAEFSDVAHERGVVSMARSRHPNSAGSQFFIVHGERVEHLDGQYAAFARVTDGLDVLDSLASVPTKITTDTGERSAPVEELTMQRIALRLRAPSESTGSEETGAEEATAKVPPEEPLGQSSQQLANTEADTSEESAKGAGEAND